MSEPIDSVESLELKISKFLRYGVLVAGAFMLAGWAGQVGTLPSEPFVAFRTYEAVPLADRLHGLWMARDWPSLTAYLGLGILISLPVTRVLLTAFLFLRQKEFVLAAVAFFVLIALAASFFLGAVE